MQTPHAIRRDYPVNQTRVEVSALHGNLYLTQCRLLCKASATEDPEIVRLQDDSGSTPAEGPRSLAGLDVGLRHEFLHLFAYTLDNTSPG